MRSWGVRSVMPINTMEAENLCRHSINCSNQSDECKKKILFIDSKGLMQTKFDYKHTAYSSKAVIELT